MIMPRPLIDAHQLGHGPGVDFNRFRGVPSNYACCPSIFCNRFQLDRENAVGNQNVAGTPRPSFQVNFPCFSDVIVPFGPNRLPKAITVGSMPGLTGSSSTKGYIAMVTGSLRRTSCYRPRNLDRCPGAATLTIQCEQATISVHN
jgi:hypothetical protein